MKIPDSVLIFLSALLLVLALNAQAVSAAPGQTVHEAEEHAEAGIRFAQRQDLNDAEAELRRAVALSPQNPQYLTELGGILGMEKKLEESTSYFEKALKLNPEDLVIRRNLASNQWQMGRFEDAKQNLQTILKAKPGDARTIVLLGMVEESLKNYPNAVELLQSVVELVRQQPESVAALAHAYYFTGEKEEARQLLEGLLENPAGLRGVILGARVAADAGDEETAEKLWRSIPSSYPDWPAVGYSLALAQYRQDHFEQSRKTLRELIAEGHETVETYNLLAWCYLREGQREEGYKVFSEAFDHIPKNESEYLKLGRALIKARFFPAAQTLAEKVIKMFPHSEQPYNLKGSAELELHSYQDALQSFSQALKLNPNSAEATLGLARAQQGAGMAQQAAATFEHGIKRFPGEVSLYTDYAEALLKLAETGDPAVEPRAVSLLQKAMAIDPSDPQPHYLLGNFLLTKSKTEQASKQLTLAARLDPSNSKIHFSLARAYRRLGRNKEATREMQVYQKTKADEDGGS